MVLNNLPAEKEKNAKASVLNAAFRLRSTLGKIDTVGLPGKKRKFLILKSWMNAAADSRRLMTNSLLMWPISRWMIVVVSPAVRLVRRARNQSEGTDEVGDTKPRSRKPRPASLLPRRRLQT